MPVADDCDMCEVCRVRGSVEELKHIHADIWLKNGSMRGSLVDETAAHIWGFHALVFVAIALEKKRLLLAV